MVTLSELIERLKIILIMIKILFFYYDIDNTIVDVINEDIDNKVNHKVMNINNGNRDNFKNTSFLLLQVSSRLLQFIYCCY